MKKNVELRNFTATITSSEDMKLGGFIPYESESLNMGFYEVLKRGCFKKTVAESRDLKFLEEHDDSKLRARGKNGSLRVMENDEGISFEVILCDTQENRDLYTKVKSGLLSNVSFGFQAIKDRWVDRNHREIIEARLFEISAVGSPAYEETVLQCRSLSEQYESKELDDAARTAIQEEIDKLNALIKPEEPKDDPEPESQPEEKPEEPSSEVSEPQSELDTQKEEPKEEDNHSDERLEELLKRLDAIENLLKEEEQRSF